MFTRWGALPPEEAESRLAARAEPRSNAFPCPAVVRDTPAYFSPASGRMVDGRADRREDLKRTGCREVERGEGPGAWRNRDWAVKRGFLKHRDDG